MILNRIHAKPKQNAILLIPHRMKKMTTHYICLLFLWSSLSGCGTFPRGSYGKPQEISYSNVQGFSPQKGEVLEWHSASINNEDEPVVTASRLPPSGLKIRWLGTAGYEISDDSTVILIDPFVSRPAFGQLIKTITIDTSAVNHYILAPIPLQNLKVILVAHAHHDHVQDVPYILAQYPDSLKRPLVVGSQNVHDLIVGHGPGRGMEWLDSIGGLQNSKIKTLIFSPGKKECLLGSDIYCDVGRFGNFKITAFASDHSSYDHLGSTAIVGSIKKHPPYNVFDYKMNHNTSIGYLIEYQGLRIFFSESTIVRHNNQIGEVDILIQGITSRRDYNTIVQTLAYLKPKYVIPSHYDNFFKPIKKMKILDTKIGLGPLNFSRFEQFVIGFERYYAKVARDRFKLAAKNFQPKLRLMKLFYYYSLVNLNQ